MHAPIDPFVAARKHYLAEQARFLSLLEAITPPLSRDQRNSANTWWYATYGDGREPGERTPGEDDA